MIEIGSSNTPARLAKFIGALTMVLGGAWVVMAFFPVKELFSRENDWLDYLLTLVIVPIMVAPGALAMLGGYQFMREVNFSNLKVMAGAYSAFGAIWISARISDAYPKLWHHHIISGFFMLGTAVLAICFYLLAMRGLLPAMGMKWNGVRSVLGKGVITMLAWLLWIALSAFARDASYDISDGFTTSLITLLGPIAVAWGFHSITVKWLTTVSPNPSTPPS